MRICDENVEHSMTEQKDHLVLGRNGKQWPYWPRLMLRKTAAAYLDMPVNAFEKEVAVGRLPVPIVIGGKERWDRVKVDEALDAEHIDDWRSLQPLYADRADHKKHR